MTKRFTKTITIRAASGEIGTVTFDQNEFWAMSAAAIVMAIHDRELDLTQGKKFEVMRETSQSSDAPSPVSRRQ